MNRRNFLSFATALGVASGSGLLSSRFAFAAGTNRLDRIGLQLYTVRDAMKSDFAGTIARVAKIGYNEVELAGYFDHSPKNVRSILDSNHITAPSAHVEYSTFGADWQKTLDVAHIIGQEMLVCPWIPDEIRKAPDGWLRAAEAFNRAGEASNKAGIKFAYHNHNFEFGEATLHGQKGYDILLAHTDPALVKMEIDLFWIILAGSDPIAYMEKNPGRVIAFHVKDMAKGYAKKEVEQSALDAEHMENVMVDVGSGGIDFAKIFKVAREAGVKHYFVEHDNPKMPFDSIRNAYNYLNALRF